MIKKIFHAILLLTTGALIYILVDLFFIDPANKVKTVFDTEVKYGRLTTTIEKQPDERWNVISTYWINKRAFRTKSNASLNPRIYVHNIIDYYKCCAPATYKTLDSILLEHSQWRAAVKEITTQMEANEAVKNSDEGWPYTRLGFEVNKKYNIGFHWSDSVPDKIFIVDIWKWDTLATITKK